jgi:hypothetical protein
MKSLNFIQIILSMSKKSRFDAKNFQLTAMKDNPDCWNRNCKNCKLIRCGVEKDLWKCLNCGDSYWTCSGCEEADEPWQVDACENEKGWPCENCGRWFCQFCFQNSQNCDEGWQNSQNCYENWKCDNCFDSHTK